jgi:hypothetical protein
MEALNGKVDAIYVDLRTEAELARSEASAAVAALAKAEADHVETKREFAALQSKVSAVPERARKKAGL